jgi:hypothetical protein
VQLEDRYAIRVQEGPTFLVDPRAVIAIDMESIEAALNDEVPVSRDDRHVCCRDESLKELVDVSVARSVFSHKFKYPVNGHSPNCAQHLRIVFPAEAMSGVRREVQRRKMILQGRMCCDAVPAEHVTPECSNNFRYKPLLQLLVWDAAVRRKEAFSHIVRCGET